MSATAVNTEPSLEHAACVARLIPGQYALSAATRRRAHPVRADGTRAAAADNARASRPAAVCAIAAFFPPKTFAADDPRELLPAVLVDYVLILATWASIASFDCAVAGILPKFFTKVPVSRAVGSGLLFAVMATLLGYSAGLYQPHRHGGVQFAILSKSLTWSLILLAAGFCLSGTGAPSFGFLASSALTSFAPLAVCRLWHERSTFATAAPKRIRNVLIVGADNAGRRVAAYLQQHPELGRVIRGFVDDGCAPSFGVLGPPEQLASIARAQFVDEVILAVPLGSDLARTVVREARRNHLDVRAVPDWCGCELSRPWIENLGAISLVTLHEERLPAVELLLKRALDVALSACVLLITAPLALLIAGLIKLDSPGPALYTGMRVGRKGRRFRCYKFRTMTVNAGAMKDQLRERNQRDGPCFKIAGDPRITRLGRWLRRCSLDELPQLWNVLRGDMSLVGPRPHPLDDFARYKLEHFRRLDVIPGITGLWQVTARRSASFQTNMALDLAYIEKWSLWLDLQILFKTVAVVFQGTGV